MAITNFETKEINCKVIYFGAPGSGKTANFRSILQNTSADIKSGMFELGEDPGPTQFFDFLPVSLGQIRDFHLKIHLHTLPYSSLYETLPSIILRGVDGIVFVADSRIEAMADNIEALDKMKRILAAEGYHYADMPRVYQYNKRDLNDLIPVEIMRQELNPAAVPDHEAIAVRSQGTMETLQLLAKQVVRKLAG